MKVITQFVRLHEDIRGDNPRALASGLSPAQADKPWYNYFIPSASV